MDATALFRRSSAGTLITLGISDSNPLSNVLVRWATVLPSLVARPHSRLLRNPEFVAFAEVTRAQLSSKMYIFA